MDVGKAKDETKKGWDAELGRGFDAGNLSRFPNGQSCARGQHSMVTLKENLEAGRWKKRGQGRVANSWLL